MRIETKHENDEIGWGEAVQLSFTRWPNGWHEVGQMAAFCLNFENSGIRIFCPKLFLVNIN